MAKWLVYVNVHLPLSASGWSMLFDLELSWSYKLGALCLVKYDKVTQHFKMSHIVGIELNNVVVTNAT